MEPLSEEEAQRVREAYAAGRQEVSEKYAFNARMVDEYKAAKEMADSAKKRADKFKKQLSDLVDADGEPDHNGHLWLELGDHKLKRERRGSRSFDTSAAESWAREAGLWDSVKEVVEVLSEDKVLAMAWDDKDINTIVREFYVEREVWAFKV